MSKKSRFRGYFDKEYRKRSEALLKSISQHFHHIHCSLARKLCQEKSLLLTCEILGLLVNILAADEKYPVLNRDNLTISVQMQLCEKQKPFSHLFSAFLKYSLNFKYCEKKMTIIDFAFSKLRTPKTYSDKCLKSPVSEDALISNMVNVPKHC